MLPGVCRLPLEGYFLGPGDPITRGLPGFVGMTCATFFRCFFGIDLWTTIIPENVTQKVPHEPQGPPKVPKIHPRGTQNQTFCE